MSVALAHVSSRHIPQIMTLKTMSLLIANGGWWLLACAIGRTAVSAWVNVPILIPATTAIENELPKPAQQRIRHLCSASRPEQLIGRGGDGC